VTGGDVDDAESPMAQTDVTVDEDAFVVGTTMPDDVAHSLKHTAI
jgi:hypothetical protein